MKAFSNRSTKPSSLEFRKLVAGTPWFTNKSRLSTSLTPIDTRSVNKLICEILSHVLREKEFYIDNNLTEENVTKRTQCTLLYSHNTIL